MRYSKFESDFSSELSTIGLMQPWIQAVCKLWWCDDVLCIKGQVLAQDYKKYGMAWDLLSSWWYRVLVRQNGHYLLWPFFCLVDSLIWPKNPCKYMYSKPQSQWIGHGPLKQDVLVGNWWCEERHLTSNADCHHTSEDPVLILKINN